MKKNNEISEIQISFWTFNLTAKGSAAVAAVKIPLMAGVTFAMISLLLGIAWRSGLLTRIL